MGIIDDLYRGGQPAESGTPVELPYEGSFGYFNDLIGAGPANNQVVQQAAQQPLNAYQLMNQQGMLDENGFLLNNPNVHGIVSAMYGGGGTGPISASNQAMNPNYQAGQSGKTLGGLGDTDGWGNPVNWSQPQGSSMSAGDTFETPAGDYKVSTNAHGQFVLVPMEGAIKTTSPYITNMTHGQHHIGINPETGETWYQEAAGYTNYSGGGNSTYTNPNGPGYDPGNDPSGDPSGDGGNPGRSWKDVFSGGVNGWSFGNQAEQQAPRLAAPSSLADTSVSAGRPPSAIQSNDNASSMNWGSLIGSDGDLTGLNEAFNDLYISGAFGSPNDPNTAMAGEAAYEEILRSLGLA